MLPTLAQLVSELKAESLQIHAGLEEMLLTYCAQVDVGTTSRFFPARVLNSRE